MRKFFSFFAVAAVVLGMASCGDGNEPDPFVNPVIRPSGRLLISQIPR